ncbi:pentapeptide repeat-containing protein [Amycolatopsis sp. cg13]|uniref:pentapeptide repeat-containing protein n=1 Tax=Amycolatopsis sp. cg13 TaxID=3238807 RepID=UPI003524308B
MTASKTNVVPRRPDWDTCSASAECIGIQVDGFSGCLAHLNDNELEAALAQLEPGADLDARGTTLSSALLARIVDALRDSAARPRFGRVWFGQATFTGHADFTNCEFTGNAVFGEARFTDDVGFNSATFSADAVFSPTWFGGVATFDDVEFEGRAHFDEARFIDSAWFAGATFCGIASFGEASFTGAGWFNDSTFYGDIRLARAQFDRASFRGAEFRTAEHLGPFGASEFWIARAVFYKQVTIEVLCKDLDGTQAVFEKGATLRLRHAKATLDRAVFNAPSAIIAANQALAHVSASSTLWKIDVRSDSDPVPELSSLAGVDVSNLVVTGVNLAHCRFTGSHHLDKLRLEGDCQFGQPPKRLQYGLLWPPVWWWTRRQVIAEEREWRLHSSKEDGWADISSKQDEHPALAKLPLPPRQLADLYRKLRKAQEDSKNEPGAADFYYGEMEMRRNDPTSPTGERLILHFYWMTCGYGLRALRALGCLAALIVLAAFAFHAWGFGSPHPALGTCLIYVAQSTVSLETKLAMLPNLTWPGEILRLAMRLLGPVFLGLALLAIRNRVKR